MEHKGTHQEGTDARNQPTVTTRHAHQGEGRLDQETAKTNRERERERATHSCCFCSSLYVDRIAHATQRNTMKMTIKQVLALAVLASTLLVAAEAVNTNMRRAGRVRRHTRQKERVSRGNKHLNPTDD